MQEYQLTEVKILSNGNDGGHIYIRGVGKYQQIIRCDFYAFFPTKAEERVFLEQFNGHNVLIACEKVEFTKGWGVTISTITSWQLTT